MKLVDILARELKEWPNAYNGGKTSAITQDNSGELNTLDAGETGSPEDFQGTVWSPVNWTLSSTVVELAEDFKTAIITHEQWKAAVGALKATAIDWSKAPEWAERVVKGPLSGQKYWANEYRRVRFDGEYNLKDKNHIEHKWKVLEHRPAAAAWNGEGLPPVGIDCERLWMSGGEYVRVRIIAHDEDQAVFRFIEGERRGDVQADVQGVGDSIGSPVFRPIKTPEQIAAEQRNLSIGEMREIWNFAATSGADPLIALYAAGYRKFEIVDN